MFQHQRTVHKNILNVRQYWVDKKILKVRATHRPKNDPRWCICNDCYEKCIIGGPKPKGRPPKPQEVLKCDKCSYVPKTKKLLRRHVKAVHDQIKDNKCQFCDYATSSKWNLKVHMMTHNNKCPVCPYSAPHKSHLTEHMIKYHTKYLKYRRESLPQEDLNIKEHDHAVPETNIDMPNLTEHMDKGPDERQSTEMSEDRKEYKCNQCTYVTRTKKLLKHHVKAVHDQIKDKKCLFCNFTASDKSNLNRHMKLHYRKCSLCPYSSPHKSQLTEHMIKYHGKNESVTRDLSKDDEGELNMKEHDYAVHEKSVGKPNLAEHIDKGPDERESTEMSNSQEKFQCNLCTYTGKTNWHLKRHVKEVHLKIKRSSSSCSNETSKRGNLDLHIVNHHEIKEMPLKKIKISDCRSMAEDSRPPYIDMVKEAIKATHPKAGTSRQAIIKYIGANYNVGDKLSKRVNDALSIGVVMGDLVRTKGQGASGSFIVATKADIQCELCKMVCKNEIHLANHIKVMHKKNPAKLSPSPKLPTHAAVPSNMAAFVEKSVAKSSPPAEPEGPPPTSSASVPSNKVPCQVCGCFCDDKIHLANHLNEAHKFLFPSDESVAAFVEKSLAKFYPPSSDAAIPSNNNVGADKWQGPGRGSWFHPDQLRIMKAYFQSNQNPDPDDEELKMLSQETNLDTITLLVSQVL